MVVLVLADGACRTLRPLNFCMLLSGLNVNRTWYVHWPVYHHVCAWHQWQEVSIPAKLRTFTIVGLPADQFKISRATTVSY